LHGYYRTHPRDLARHWNPRVLNRRSRVSRSTIFRGRYFAYTSLFLHDGELQIERICSSVTVHCGGASRRQTSVHFPRGRGNENTKISHEGRPHRHVPRPAIPVRFFTVPFLRRGLKSALSSCCN